MAYQKTDWKDTVRDSQGNLIQKGTPLNAAILNKIEEGIVGAESKIPSKISQLQLDVDLKGEKGDKGDKGDNGIGITDQFYIGTLNGTIQGMNKASSVDTIRLNNFGLHFEAMETGYIKKVSIYSATDTQIKIGLVKQESAQLATETVSTKIVSLLTGWNEIVLNYKVVQSTRYTLYAEFLQAGGGLGRTLNMGTWSTNSSLKKDKLRFIYGMYANSTTTGTVYYAFHDIEFIPLFSALGMHTSFTAEAKPDIYVGDTPPLNVGIWFKPVGGTQA